MTDTDWRPTTEPPGAIGEFVVWYEFLDRPVRWSYYGPPTEHQREVLRNPRVAKWWRPIGHPDDGTWTPMDKPPTGRERWVVVWYKSDNLRPDVTPISEPLTERYGGWLLTHCDWWKPLGLPPGKEDGVTDE